MLSISALKSFIFLYKVYADKSGYLYKKDLIREGLSKSVKLYLKELYERNN